LALVTPVIPLNPLTLVISLTPVTPAGPLAATTVCPVRFLNLLAQSRRAESLSPLACPPPTAPPMSPMTKAYASDDG
jgi:hypothetical protein